MNGTKPGWKTTEFALTVVAQIVAFAAMKGWITTADAGILTDAATKIVAGLIAAVAIWKYIHSRAVVKTAVAATTPFVLLAFLSMGSVGCTPQKETPKPEHIAAPRAAPGFQRMPLRSLLWV